MVRLSQQPKRAKVLLQQPQQTDTTANRPITKPLVEPWGCAGYILLGPGLTQHLQRLSGLQPSPQAFQQQLM